ncbi:hypothetical protein CKA32_002469 [Geitlerinema sp. FC II]|nr:hypothetical protein CKA32_002469 [Geitlerinema sp. FC II]
MLKRTSNVSTGCGNDRCCLSPVPFAGLACPRFESRYEDVTRGKREVRSL